MSTPELSEPIPPEIALDRVHTPADAAAWLRQRANAFIDDASTEASPVEARVLRLAGSTLDVFASVVAEFRHDEATRELGRLAGGYRHPDADATEPLPAEYRRACTHVADNLSRIHDRLARTTAVQRRPGTPARSPAPARGPRLDL